MPILTTGGAILAAGALGAGSSMLGSIMGSNAASKSAKDAAALQAKQFEQTRADLAPYNLTGQSVLPNMQALAFGGMYGPGGKNYLDMAEQNLPGHMTQAELEATPGYQWNLSQGLKSAQSAVAARGLGVSGSALKGATKFATGLADSTYKNQFDMRQTQFSDIFNIGGQQQTNLNNMWNRMSGLATLGEAAAAQTGTLGTAAAKTEGQGLMSAGQYTAAGYQGAGNAVQNAANNYLQYAAYRDMGTKGTPANPVQPPQQGAVGGGQPLQ